MREVFIVAEKELRDFFTGRRFLILMGVMLLLVIIGIISGMQSYNTQLDQYKAQQAQNAPMIAQQQQQIAQMEASGASQDEIDAMQSGLDSMMNQPMPSFLTVFYSFYNVFNFVAVILAIIMGFDMISGERESGSLRLLLTRPTYRDSVINGKALAGVLVIAILLVAVFLVTMAALLMSQIVPSGDDLARVVAYFVVTMLFMTAIFALSLLASTLSHTSRMAILCMLGVFVFMYVLTSSVGSVASAAMGAPPESPQYPTQEMTSTPPVMDVNGTMAATPVPTLSPEMQAYQDAEWKYQNDSANYYKTQQQIYDLASLASPMDSYSYLTSVILSKQKQMTSADMYSNMNNNNNWILEQYKQISLFDSLSNRWGDLIALIVVIVAAFGLSYLSFMRSDVS